MPGVKGSNPLAAKLKELKGDFEETKKNETDFGGGGSLPGGINAGIAEFAGAKFDTYKSGPNEGKLYMSLTGIVKKPDEYRGMQTRIRVDLFSKNPPGGREVTRTEQVNKALNEMRKLGIDTSDLSFDDWIPALEAAAKEGIVFRFHTFQNAPTKQYPDPKVFENWDGKIDHYVSNGTGPAVEDSTGDTSEDWESSEGPETEEETDWMALAKKATNDDDEDAKNALKEACAAIGVDSDSLDTWEEAAQTIIDGGSGDSSGGDSSTGWTPEVGDELEYKPKGPGKPSACEITKVTKTTLTLKRKSDGKVYASVPYTSDPPSLDGKEF